ASVLEGYIPEFDATVVTRLLDAGAEIVGKSVCEYFSFSGGAATSTTGPVHNPRAMGHNAGGSSTGSGAPVAARHVHLPTPRLSLRRGRHEAYLGPRSLYGHHGHGPDHRSRRAAHRASRR